MIYAIIIIGTMGIVIIALAVFNAATIQRNRRLNREKKLDKYALESALADKEALKRGNSRLQENIEDLHRENQHYRESVATTLQALNNENRRLQAENSELAARNTALVETMEARPTQPAKRVPRRGTQASTEGAS